MKRALLIGNSDGIGLAIARALLATGWCVSGISRSPSPVVNVAYRHTVCDVRSGDYAALLAKVAAETEPLDVCIYCAGIGEFLNLDDLSSDVRVFEVNLMGALVTAQVVIPSMLKASSGHFIVLSSLADSLISADAPSYAASKAGLSAYFEGLALALRSKGVAVSVVCFGFVRTKMAKSARLPWAISPEKAASVVLKTMGTRRVRVAYPRLSALAVHLLGCCMHLRVWWSSTRPGKLS